MTQQGRGVVLLSASSARAVEWVRRGVVPCHVLEHSTWSIVVPATSSSAAAAPYDDALTVLAARHVPTAIAPSIGLLEIGDAAVITARAPGRSPIRWALRGADREVVRGPQLPPLTPESLHRTLAAGSGTREVPIRAVRDLSGGRVLDGSDTALGPVIAPNPRSVQDFESAVKDVHQ